VRVAGAALEEKVRLLQFVQAVVEAVEVVGEASLSRLRF
jgi:hypothetical protein